MLTQINTSKQQKEKVKTSKIGIYGIFFEVGTSQNLPLS